MALGLATSGQAEAASTGSLASQLFTPATLAAYPLEMMGLALVAVFVTNLVLGRRRNYAIAKSWSDAHAVPDDGVIARNFGTYGHLGAADKGLAWQEGASCYRFYASGRRNCAGALFTLQLKGRQDLLSSLWSLVSPAEDTLVVEMMLPPEAAPLVLAVATPKAMRTLAKDQGDVASYCKAISVARDRMPNWPGTLAVMVEQSAPFYDVFGEARVLGVLGGRDEASAAAMRHFRSLRYSSECRGAYPIRLVLTAALPQAEQMDELQPLLALVFALTDLFAAYKLPPEARKKAAELRAKVAADAAKKEEEGQQSAAAARQEKKLKEEAEKLAAMTPEARAKYKERQTRIEQKRQLRARQKMVRV